MKNKVLSVYFGILLLAGVILHIAVPDKYYSESEKRTLAKSPKFSAESFLSGEFSDKLEKYLADQFPGRDGWISVKTFAELGIGMRECNGVYFGKDGYLISSFDGYNRLQFEKNVSVLESFSENMEKKGIAVRVMLVPTAVEILDDKLPRFAPHISQREMLEYVKGRKLDVVDVSDILSQHKNEYIYYKTDHHYTSLGAYYCYSEWKCAKGESAEPLWLWDKEVLSEKFRGTNYSKVNYPLASYDYITACYRKENHNVSYNNGSYVTDSIYERKYLDGKDQYAVFFNSNQATTVIDGDGEGRLLIIKDSYANCFAQFVIDEYEQTHLLDMRFYKKSVSEYISENNITEVLVLYNIPNFAGDAAFYPY